MAVISTSFSSSHKLAATKISTAQTSPSHPSLEHAIQTIDQTQLRLAVLELCRTNPEAAKSLSPLISAPAAQGNKRSASDNTLISARPRKVLATRTARNVSGFGFGGALQPKSDVYMNEIFASRSDGCCKSNMMENSRREDVEMMWVD